MTPDGPTAKDWLAGELARPEYVQAKPTWFDLLAKAFADWIASLRFGGLQGPPAFGIGIIVVLVVVAIVVAFLIFGMPRLNRRSAVTGALFGTDDDRTAADMRESAHDAAGRADFASAIAEMFRALARGLAERTIVTTSPGTTAHDFSIRAAIAFPGLDVQFAEAAAAFDDVRYLGGNGDRARYDALAALERAVRNTRAELQSAPQ